jgi:hypothetical protein
MGHQPKPKRGLTHAFRDTRRRASKAGGNALYEVRGLQGAKIGRPRKGIPKAIRKRIPKTKNLQPILKPLSVPQIVDERKRILERVEIADRLRG